MEISCKRQGGKGEPSGNSRDVVLIDQRIDVFTPRVLTRLTEQRARVSNVNGLATAKILVYWSDRLRLFKHTHTRTHTHTHKRWQDAHFPAKCPSTHTQTEQQRQHGRAQSSAPLAESHAPDPPLPLVRCFPPPTLHRTDTPDTAADAAVTATAFVLKSTALIVE